MTDEAKYRRACEWLIVIAACIGVVYFGATAHVWGPIVDNMECGVPKVAKRVQL